MYMPNMSTSSISSTAASFTVEEEGNNINGNGNEYENCPDECLYFVVDIDRAVPLVSSGGKMGGQGKGKGWQIFSRADCAGLT
jgi:hypothetical protein